MKRNSALVMSLPHSGCAAPAAPDQLRPNATQAALPSPRAPYYHFNIDMTDKAIGWIQGTRSLTPNRPQSLFSGQLQWAANSASGRTVRLIPQISTDDPLD